MKKSVLYALSLTLFFLPFSSFGQTNPDPNNVTQDPDSYDPPDGGGDPGAPIDAGVTVLLAAGVGYGIKKFRDSRRRPIRAES